MSSSKPSSSSFNQSATSGTAKQSSIIFKISTGSTGSFFFKWIISVSSWTSLSQSKSCQTLSTWSLDTFFTFTLWRASYIKTWIKQAATRILQKSSFTVHLQRLSASSFTVQTRTILIREFKSNPIFLGESKCHMLKSIATLKTSKLSSLATRVPANSLRKLSSLLQLAAL